MSSNAHHLRIGTSSCARSDWKATTWFIRIVNWQPSGLPARPRAAHRCSPRGVDSPAAPAARPIPSFPPRMPPALLPLLSHTCAALCDRQCRQQGRGQLRPCPGRREFHLRCAGAVGEKDVTGDNEVRSPPLRPAGERLAVSGRSRCDRGTVRLPERRT
eukprot:766044-Hanusia_phi.AAC.8